MTATLCKGTKNYPTSLTQGHILACGDFGGNVHLWDVRIVDNASRVQVRNYRKFEAHKGHVVCLQLNARRIVTGA